MSTITRTIVNFFKIGPRQYWHQLNYIGDTKAGRLVGTDRFGNKYYENNDELPLRTRWVDMKEHDHDPGHIEPGWHAWISYMIDSPPDTSLPDKREWASLYHTPNQTMTRAAFKTYNTTIPKLEAWEPKVAARSG